LERFPVQPSEKEVIDGIMGNRNEWNINGIIRCFLRI
jgi:hypothetical protein